MTYLLIIFPLNVVPLSAKFSTMYIPFDKEEMSIDAVPGLFGCICFCAVIE